MATGVLPNRDSEIAGATVRIANTNAILMTLTKQIRQRNKIKARSCRNW